MLSFSTIVMSSRRAAAMSALAIGVFACSGSAVAAPQQLFPFPLIPAPQTQVAAPPTVEAAPSDEDAATPYQLPQRLRRQIVSYSTREATGTIIIDTPNTYLYYVLGNGQAVRYGIGVGRDGFTWSGIQSVTRK